MAPSGRRRMASSVILPLNFLALLCFIFLSSSPVTTAASTVGHGVIGIDLGTEYLKAALVKPGVPLEIVLTKDSKRKEAAAVAFKPARDNNIPGGSPFPERYYGGSALSLAPRFPNDVYSNLKVLLGIPFSEGVQGPDGGVENVVNVYKGRYPAMDIGEIPGRGTVGFKSGRLGEEHGNDRFLVEELLSMQLKQVKANADSMGNQPTRINDAVITFPAFYTAEEKRSVELAAELAGLNVLSMISDGTAVGLNYATSRTFPSVSDGNKPEYHVIYDMGAGSTTATVLRFQSRVVKDIGKFNKTVQEIQAIGTGWDKTLGGDSLNQIIVEDIINKFVESKKLKDGATVQDVKAHGKTMAKLWNQSERIRQILSANSDSVASFEGLFHDDVNFKYKITRAEFEKLAEDYARRVTIPLTTALDAAKLGLNDVESIILHGGAIRTPFVQKQLEAISKGSGQLRTNVNADEAAVFGAAFKGAALSPSFRVKEIRTGDTPGFVVGMKWNAGDREKQQKLFTPTSETGAEKQVTLKNLEDFELKFYQQYSRNGDGIDAPVLGVQTKNLTESVATLKDKFGCTPANITTKFSVQLSPVNGLPEVLKGSVSCEVQNEKKGVVEDVKEFLGFGSKKDEQAPLKDEETKESVTSSTESSSTSETTSSATSETTTSSTPKQSEEPSTKDLKARVESIPIDFSSSPLGVPALSTADVERIKGRLAAFDASDLARVEREEIFNTLESFTYRTQDLITNDDFVNVIAKESLETLKEKLSEASEWLYGDGSDAPTKDITAKLKELKKLVNPVLARQREHSFRPTKVDALKRNLGQAKTMIGVMEQRIKAEESLHSASPSQPDSTSTSSSTSTSTSGGTQSESSSSTASPQSSSESPSDSSASPDGETSSSTSTSTSASTKPTSSFSLFKPSDVSHLSTVHDTINTWLEKQTELQDKLNPTEDPVLTVKDLDTKIGELERSLNSFLTKMGQQYGRGNNGKGNNKKTGKEDKSKKEKKGKDKQKDEKEKKDTKDEL